MLLAGRAEVETNVVAAVGTGREHGDSEAGLAKAGLAVKSVPLHIEGWTRTGQIVH